VMRQSSLRCRCTMVWCRQNLQSVFSCSLVLRYHIAFVDFRCALVLRAVWGEVWIRLPRRTGGHHK
jgi:hypothetical protein